MYQTKLFRDILLFDFNNTPKGRDRRRQWFNLPFKYHKTMCQDISFQKSEEWLPKYLKQNNNRTLSHWFIYLQLWHKFFFLNFKFKPLFFFLRLCTALYQFINTIRIILIVYIWITSVIKIVVGSLTSL